MMLVTAVVSSVFMYVHVCVSMHILIFGVWAHNHMCMKRAGMSKNARSVILQDPGKVNNKTSSQMKLMSG